MSLINARNLVSPLTNKVHLMTIILIAIAFAVLRLSGGKVARTDSRSVLQSNPTGGYQTAPTRSLPSYGVPPANGGTADANLLPFGKSQQAQLPADAGRVAPPWQQQQAAQPPANTGTRVAPPAQAQGQGGQKESLSDLEDLLGLN